MDKPAHFVIVGGGTAGWITAFILQDSIRRLKLNARLSVVESSKIPTVEAKLANPDLRIEIQVVASL